jgi:hypothetical protein
MHPEPTAEMVVLVLLLLFQAQSPLMLAAVVVQYTLRVQQVE